MPLVNKEAYNAYMKIYARERYHRLRREWIESQGGKCTLCGSVEDLEIDHVDRATKSFDVARIWSRSKVVREEELAKCQVLCKKCHLKKTTAENIALGIHSEEHSYRKKCRCPGCREWVRDYKFHRGQKDREADELERGSLPEPVYAAMEEF